MRCGLIEWQLCVFFFQAEDGIRDVAVTGVQTCALPISSDALQAAMEAQQQLHNEAWSPAPIKVRMGIHTGTAQLADDPTIEGPYSGYGTLALTQRIMSAAHGGQILLSQSTYELTRDELAEKNQFMDMGEHRLKHILRPVHLYQLN